MIRIQQFTKLQVCNLFTYFCDTRPSDTPKLFTLDLAGASTERPVAIISGRNGFGKTSLLNCLRLLFFGPSLFVQERAIRVRGGMQPGQDEPKPYVLNERNFVLGIPGVWDGILNTRARETKQKEYFVHLWWTEQGGPCQARRSWTLDRSGGYIESLSFERAGISLDGKQAELALRDRLPEYFAPFYMFDGEDLQNLADTFLVEPIEDAMNAPRNPLAELVGIKQIAMLRMLLAEIARSLPRRARLLAKDKEQRDYVHQIDSLDSEISALEEEEEELRREISAKQKQLGAAELFVARMREVGFDSPGGRAILERRIEEIESRLESEESLSSLRELMASAFLLVRPDLVDATIRHLEAIQSHPTQESRRLLDQLRARILPCLTSPPYSTPPLSRSQQEFYTHRLEGIFTEFDQAVANAQHFSPSATELRPDEIPSVLDELRPYTLSGEIHSSWRRWLEERARLRSERDELARTFKNATDSSETDRSTYEEKLNSVLTLKSEIKTLSERLSRLPSERKTLAQKRSTLEGKLLQLQSAITEGRIIADMGSLARLLADEVLWAYQEGYSATIARDLSQLTTKHFTQDLMSSHDLIQRIEIGRGMSVLLFDKEGRRVGGRTPSEGMKQLLATALLWALCDVTKHRIPLVIDTPMGRLDGPHRLNLVEKYFPRAAGQVLIFPTAGELDRNLYKLLRPYVYKEYRIVNPDGRSAYFEEGKLWQ